MEVIVNREGAGKLCIIVVYFNHSFIFFTCWFLSTGSQGSAGLSLYFNLTRRVCCPAGSRMLSSVASLEAPLICCLGPLIQYLQEFNLDRVLRSQRSGYVHVSWYTSPPSIATGKNLQTTSPPPFVIWVISLLVFARVHLTLPNASF